MIHSSEHRERMYQGSHWSFRRASSAVAAELWLFSQHFVSRHPKGTVLLLTHDVVDSYITSSFILMGDI